MLKCALLLTIVAIGINVTTVESSCCKRVNARYHYMNDAYVVRKEFFGYYTMQRQRVNGRVYYLKDDGSGKAIYYEKYWTSSDGNGYGYGQWQFVNETKYVWQNYNHYFSYFYANSSAICPYEQGIYWAYRDKYDIGIWHDAGYGFSIWSTCCEQCND